MENQAIWQLLCAWINDLNCVSDPSNVLSIELQTDLHRKI